VAGDESCDDAVLAVAAALKEDVRRSVSPDANQSIPVPRYQSARLTLDDRLDHEPGRDWPPDERPLVTALRI
jgi:hypothetical protein